LFIYFIDEDRELSGSNVVVTSPNGFEDGMFSPSIEVSVVPGSVWIKSISPTQQRFPIGTIMVRFSSNISF
jgi:hypothetical protein